MVSRYPFLSAVFLLVALFASACERLPGADTLRDEIAGVLAEEFRPGILEVVSIRRMGSAPHRDKATDDQRLTIYFNAELRFREDFDLTAWDALNAASLAFLLGATDKGIDGIQQGGNRQGDVLRVHGSRIYALRQGAWRPLLVATRKSSETVREAKTPKIITRINELAERAAQRFGGVEQALIENELSAALKRIERSMDQLADTYSVASGPVGGAYHRYIQTLEDNAKRIGLRVRNNATEGSVENCQLVQAGGVDIAIAQSNIATLAVSGEGPFDAVGRLTDIRALSALFPEYLHVVVANRAGISDPAALAGKRVDLGLPASGTRVDALRLLSAARLRLQDFAQISESGLDVSINAMRAGELDAFFTTLQAPGRALQNLLASGEARLLPIPLKVQEEMLEKHGIYRQAEIVAHTYPGQPEAIPTLSVTAILIVRADLPDANAQQILDRLFNSSRILARHNLRLSLLARHTAREGLSIPLHPAAEAYLSEISGLNRPGHPGD